MVYTVHREASGMYPPWYCLYCLRLKETTKPYEGVWGSMCDDCARERNLLW